MGFTEILAVGLYRKLTLCPTMFMSGNLDTNSTMSFLQFLMNYVTDVSYGTKEVKLSTGESLTCQNAVQQVSNELIIRNVSL